MLYTLIAMYPVSGVKIFHFESTESTALMKRALKIAKVPFICIEEEMGLKNDVEFVTTPNV